MIALKTIYILSILFSINMIAMLKDENSKDPLNALLLMAIEAQNSIVVKKMLEKGAQANILILEVRPLHLALTHGNKEIIKMLLDAGALVQKTITFKGKVYTALELLELNIKHYVIELDNYAQDLEHFKNTLVKDQEYIEKIVEIENAYNRYKAKLQQYQQLHELLESYKI